MPPNVGVGVGGRPDAQAMLAQQNREMEALERRSQRERSASMNPGQVSIAFETRRGPFLGFSFSHPVRSPHQQRQPPPQPPQRLDEEDSADELEHISTRTLALTRYTRNHELMNEVFAHAAFGGQS